MNEKPVILLVDDEAELLEVMAECLEPLRAEMLKARNGKEALSLLEQHKVDVVLSDIKMPVMTGLELLGEMNKLEHKVPFIVLTGFGDKYLLKEAWRKGAFDFIDKPVDPQTLTDIVKSAIAVGKRVVEARDSAPSPLEPHSGYLNVQLSESVLERLEQMSQSKGTTPTALAEEILSDFTKKAA